MLYDFGLYGAYNFPSPYLLALNAEEGESLSFFIRLAALSMVLLRQFKILLGERSEGAWMACLFSYKTR